MAEPQNRENTSSFPQLEAEVLKFWEENRIFEKSVAQEAPKGDYVFYDGPPFATGTPHYGHIVGQIMKDVVPRYYTMNGYQVERKWGWDCHGLPIENIVEKELGTQTKKEIVELGVAKFNDLCRSKVLTYAEEWYRIARKLGRWADMEHAYKTMDLDYMESIWAAFKQLWDKDLIYKAYRSMHVCPRCETTLSQSEVSEGYKDVKDLSCIAKFELLDEPGTYVLAWTTTPWTLIGNVALAVGADIDYVKVYREQNGKGEYFILAKNIFDNKESSVYKEFSRVSSFVPGDPLPVVNVVANYKGSDLVGKAYKPLFDYYASDKNLENREQGWKIYAGDFVTTDEGTGVVHIAPAFGEDDMNLGKAYNLPFVQHVSMDGIFKPEVKDFPGLHVKPLGDHTTTDIEIIKYLAHNGLLFSKEKYEHSYPHCWRCDTPLINYATSSWFVAVSKIKPQLLEYAKDINWSPNYLKEGRFGNWLEGARDWSISRQRFWASAIPIWECACGERQVIGSVAELERLTGAEINDIHKDKIDHLTFKCHKCHSQMKRIPDVLDCWFESGSMPYAQLHYPFENQKKFEDNFPAQFIAEGIDQTRCWFYYMHVIAGALKGTHAFNNVIANGIVLAEDGKKMSKRLKNYPDPELIIDKYGSDSLRAYLLGSSVMQAENLNFSEKGVAESLRKNVMVLWNVFKFYELYAAEAQPGTNPVSNPLDLWIIAKLKLLVKEISGAMAAYDLPRALRPITAFIDELSTWYLRRSRDRFKGEDSEDKQAALVTMKTVFERLSQAMAPFLPFLAERLWQETMGYHFSNADRSVHLTKWPELGELSQSESEVLERMAAVRRVVEAGLAARDQAGIKIRQMLASATISGLALSELPADYQPIICDELNVRRLEIIPGSAPELSVALDLVITPDLKQAGLQRDLIRYINLMRKENNLSLQDSAVIHYAGASEFVEQAIAASRNEILRETLSADIIGSTPLSGWKKEVKLDEETVTLYLVLATEE